MPVGYYDQGLMRALLLVACFIEIVEIEIPSRIQIDGSGIIACFRNSRDLTSKIENGLVSYQHKYYEYENSRKYTIIWK